MPGIRDLILILAFSLGSLVIGAGAATAETAPVQTGPAGLWSLYPIGTATTVAGTTPPAGARPAISVPAPATAPGASPAKASAEASRGATFTDGGGGASDSHWWVVGALALAALAVVAAAVPRAEH